MKRTLTLLAALLPAPLVALHAADFFVATTGNNTNLGTEEQPFATIQAGVNRLQPGDTLLIRGGVYRETVTFPRGGTVGKRITVKAHPGEKVVVTGCEPVTGWTLHDAAKKIWKAPMPWTLGQGRNQVFCDGNVLIEARFPNQPAPGLELPVADLDPMWPTYGEFSIPDRKQHRRIVSKLLEGQPDDYWKGAMYCGFHLFSIDWLSLERAGAPIHFPLPGGEGLPRDPLVEYRPIERSVPDTATVLPRASRRQPRDRRLAERDGSHPGGRALAAVLPVTNGLTLWLRSDRGVETDAKGRVRQWNDLSGHGYHAKQLAVPYARPVLDNAVGFRGLPAVVFDGEDDALRCSTPLGLQAQREFSFAILCRSEFTAERQWPQRVFSLEPAAGEDYARPEAFAVTLTDDTDPAKGGGLTLVQDDGAPDRLGLDDWAAGTNPVVQRALVWVKKEDAPGKGSVRVMADGQPAGTDTYAFASTDAPPNKGYLLGTRLNDTARCTPVEVFEVILHDRVLNDSEIEALNRYLQRK